MAGGPRARLGGKHNLESSMSQEPPKRYIKLATCKAVHAKNKWHKVTAPKPAPNDRDRTSDNLKLQPHEL